MPYFIPKKTPLRLVPWTISQFSSVCSCRGMIGPPNPALLNSTSSLPNCSSAVADHRLNVGFDRDIDVNCNGGGADDLSRSPPRRRCGRRTPPLPPSAANNTAEARPMPEPAPVMTATLPSSLPTNFEPPPDTVKRLRQVLRGALYMPNTRVPTGQKGLPTVIWSPKKSLGKRTD